MTNKYLEKIASPRFVREAMNAKGVLSEFQAIGTVKGNWRQSESWKLGVTKKPPEFPFNSQERNRVAQHLKTVRSRGNNFRRHDQDTPANILGGYQYHLQEKLNPPKKY
jgi:hypothetical protein